MLACNPSKPNLDFPAPMAICAFAIHATSHSFLARHAGSLACRTVKSGIQNMLFMFRPCLFSAGTKQYVHCAKPAHFSG